MGDSTVLVLFRLGWLARWSIYAVFASVTIIVMHSRGFNIAGIRCVDPWAAVALITVLLCFGMLAGVIPMYSLRTKAHDIMGKIVSQVTRVAPDLVHALTMATLQCFAGRIGHYYMLLSLGSDLASSISKGVPTDVMGIVRSSSVADSWGLAATDYIGMWW